MTRASLLIDGEPAADMPRQRSMSDTVEIWYRFDDVSYATLSNAETETWSSRLEVELRRFKVVRCTPKGVWLALHFEGCTSLAEPRFVLRASRKRYACPTIDEARASFVARKRAQIRIHGARVRRARQALAAIEARP